jgi:NAD(P)-dependent dehydrogenase (short-subunit alcohol dehydrogenase family)
MPSFKIQGSVAFATGTSKPRGIGRAIVEALLANGASKVYATARTTSQLDDLVAQHNGQVVAVPLDVTDLDAIAALSESYPDVTIIVNNAGYLSGSTSLGDVDAVKTEMLVNYIAPMAIGKAFASVFANVPSVEEDVKPTALVNINSILSFVNAPACATYSASKAGAHSLTQAQRRD